MLRCRVEKVDFSKVESIIWQQQKVRVPCSSYIRVYGLVVVLKCWQKTRGTVAVFKSTKEKKNDHVGVLNAQLLKLLSHHLAAKLNGFFHPFSLQILPKRW